MSIAFVNALDMSGNPIENVEQLDSPTSVVTVGKLETDLSTKANIVHSHDAIDIQGFADIFQNITLDGGVL